MVRFCIFIEKPLGRREIVYDNACLVTGNSTWSWAEARDKRRELAQQEPDAKVWLAVVCLPVTGGAAQGFNSEQEARAAAHD